MDPRIFNQETEVWTSDGTHFDKFKAGERVKNIRRIARGVFFEPADPTRIVVTYAMDWDRFIANTTAVHEAGA
jgi:hypothetical protein